jgi:hypothetical protein
LDLLQKRVLTHVHKIASYETVATNFGGDGSECDAAHTKKTANFVQSHPEFTEPSDFLCMAKKADTKAQSVIRRSVCRHRVLQHVKHAQKSRGKAIRHH